MLNINTTRVKILKNTGMLYK